MNFENFMTVFECSVVTDSMSKMILCFSTVYSSWVIIFDCIIDFSKFEVVLGCLSVTNFVSPLSLLFGILEVFDALWNVNFFSFFFNDS